MNAAPAIPTGSALAEPAAHSLPAGLRARVWVDARHFFSRANVQEHAWLWLLRADGRVQALRLRAACAGRDDLLARWLNCADPDRGGMAGADPVFGEVWTLPSAPVVPVPRWAVSWGHPLQRAIRAFADALDEEVLQALGDLEAPGPYFGSVENYNRLASLPQPRRRHRLQALATFPPLVAPLLLARHERPDLFGRDDCESDVGDETGADISSPVLDAMDRGRDLIGALASEYRIDRALARSPLFREPWVAGDVPRSLLRLLRAIPAHLRPRTREAAESRLPQLAALPVRVDTSHDVARLANAFVGGWDDTWRRLEALFQPLPSRLRDSRDFLQSALDQADLPAQLARLETETLALAWIARRGLASLLRASRRWHAQPLIETRVRDGLPDEILPLFGTFEHEEGSAIERTTRETLRAEGEAMHHCVGGYWDQCVLGPARIVHLRLADGETATAQFDCGGSPDEPHFHGIELSGPCNAACSPSMHRFARRIEDLLNSDALRGLRVQALRDSDEARAARFPAVRQSVRPLDHRSRDELRQVLAYCERQADWQVRGTALFRGAIAGFCHAQGPRVLARLEAGDPLDLVREPQNPHDPRAVRIDWNGCKLGYMPRQDNAPIARRLDAGEVLVATIVAVRTDDRWMPVDCAVAHAPQLSASVELVEACA